MLRQRLKLLLSRADQLSLGLPLQLGKFRLSYKLEAVAFQSSKPESLLGFVRY